jgi:DNA repair protein RAD5
MTLPPKLGKLFLSAKAKASGANLQCATNVVLLDPTGPSAEHGAALENQAIGRAVRMEQANAVKVVRFCVKDSIEEKLFGKLMMLIDSWRRGRITRPTLLKM